jgi:hypothetical protein
VVPAKALADHRGDRKNWLTQTLGLPATDPNATPGNPSTPATKTTSPPRAAFCASSPTASAGNKHSTRREDDLERFAEPGERGFVFIGPKGGKLRRSNFHKSVWDKARRAVGLPNLHFHDLRHTGGTLSAATGATLKELMARLGHSSIRAAMIYQHATRDRDQAIAKALGTFVREINEATEKTPEEPERGAQGA